MFSTCDCHIIYYYIMYRRHAWWWSHCQQATKISNIKVHAHSCQFHLKKKLVQKLRASVSKLTMSHV